LSAISSYYARYRTLIIAHFFPGIWSLWRIFDSAILCGNYRSFSGRRL